MKIYVKPRIHISLLSMHHDEYRMNGGIGFCIDEPKAVLTFSESTKFSFTDRRKYAWADSERNQLLQVLTNARQQLKLKKCMNIALEGELLSHFGMGSGTGIRLACLEGLTRLNDFSLTPNELVKLSHRGGTSGIGIHTYFSGQFVFDLGVKQRGSSFEPSSNHKSPQRPLLLNALNFPNWKIGICIPTNIPPKTRKEETEFFAKTCPISPQESYKTVFHSLFGAYASIKECDLYSFTESVREIQRCEWKKSERKEYSSELFDLENKLYELGAMCVGMSSLGPILFFLAPQTAYAHIQDQMDGVDSKIIVTTASNSGREIVM